MMYAAANDQPTANIIVLSLSSGPVEVPSGPVRWTAGPISR